MSSKEALVWYGFGRQTTLGAKRMSRLRLFFHNNMEAAWHASQSDLTELFGPRIAERVLRERDRINLETEAERCKAAGVQLLPISHADYPELLAEIHDPPPLLYYRGSLDALKRPSISIVGTRKATTYGKMCTRELVSGLVPQGCTITSGLAYGIDITAHRATLEFSGSTIAVLPGGLDDASIAPVQHQTTARQITESGGLLLSEYAPLTQAFKGHFPVRNRIIAGISRATIVIEAAIKSGTLITARAALSENRDVGAVPGPIGSPLSQGSHSLLKDGAALIENADDILNLLSINTVPLQQSIPTLTRDESLIYAHIEARPTSIDELVRQSGKPASVVNGILLGLELKSCTTPAGAGHVARTALTPYLSTET